MRPGHRATRHRRSPLTGCGSPHTRTPAPHSAGFGGVRYPAGMDETTTVTSEESDDTTDDLLDDELLVEEISIDGMCGVY